MRVFHMAALALGFGLCWPAVGKAELKVEEKIVGPEIVQGVSYAVSAIGTHTAVLAMSGSRFVVLHDGVESPKYEEVLQAAADVELSFDASGFINAERVVWQGPVAISADGKRHAYCAREGKEAFVILDGKEIFRGPAAIGTRPLASLMSFTPDGKHLYFFTPTNDSFASVALVMDGQPQQSLENVSYPRFSPDGGRYAYLGDTPGANKRRVLVIDSKPAGYDAVRPQFTPDGQHVVSVDQSQPGQQTLLVDGKPLLQLKQIEQIALAGQRIALIGIDKDNQRLAFVDGRPAPSSEQAQRIFLSPDAKHWAAVCYSGQSAWVVIDGNKGQPYSGVQPSGFTSDSAKFVYVADSGGRKFVVANDQESAGYTYIITPPVFSKGGGHFYYVAGASPMAGQNVYVDGKPLPVGVRARSFLFSPDGSRYVCIVENDAISSTLVVDGQVQQCSSNGSFLFSDDSKHLAVIGAPPKGYESLWIDGKFLPLPPRISAPRLLSFTPDGKHLFMQANAESGGTIYCDGVKATEFRFLMNNLMKNSWSMDADGTFTVIGRTAGGVKRAVIVPSSDTSLAKMAEEYEAQQAQASADTAKAQADQEAAQLKAAEQAKADAETRAKARQEALQAKAKAKADAAAAKAKAKADAEAARAAKKKN